jgi:hypothetical protein
VPQLSNELVITEPFRYDGRSSAELRFWTLITGRWRKPADEEAAPSNFQHMALKRYGHVDGIASFVTYVASPEASLIRNPRPSPAWQFRSTFRTVRIPGITVETARWLRT